MASTSETGHAKNVSNFEDLISFCSAYGTQYNPSKPALSIRELTTQLNNANAVLQELNVAKTAYNNATNAREVAFKPVRAFATKVINALAAAGATKQTMDDVKSINAKLQGRRMKAIAKEDEAAKASGEEPAKRASVSQQSFNNVVEHIAQLITTVIAEPAYLPNEDELKPLALNALLAELRAKNTQVISTGTILSNARISRNRTLYGEGTGLVATSLAVKAYVKSVFGSTNPKFKQISGLKFADLSDD